MRDKSIGYNPVEIEEKCFTNSANEKENRRKKATNSALVSWRSFREGKSWIQFWSMTMSFPVEFFQAKAIKALKNEARGQLWNMIDHSAECHAPNHHQSF